MPLNEILAILMLVAFFVLLLAGIPVAVTLATAGLVFGYIGFGPLLFHLLPNRIYGVVTNYTLIAMPLFVFMGVMLEKSRLAEDLRCRPCCGANTTRAWHAESSAPPARSARSFRPASS